MSNGANGVHLQLREALENYIKSQYFGKSPILLSAAQNKLNQEGVLYQKPYVESSPAYKSSPNGIQLSPKLPDWLKDYFKALSDANLGVYPSPFCHQISALEAAFEGQDLFVSTGTGSGKTECFMWPLMAKLASEARNNPDSWAMRGVRTIIMYPMNALVSDQISRLRRLIGDPDHRFINIFRTACGNNSRRPQFGMYTGRTPYAGKEPRRSEDRSLAATYSRMVNPENDEEKAFFEKLIKGGKLPAKENFDEFLEKLYNGKHMFRGDPRKPWIDISSEKITQRHLGMVALQTYLREKSNSLDAIPAIEFLDEHLQPFSRFLEIFEISKDDILVPVGSKGALGSYKDELEKSLSALKQKRDDHPELFETDDSSDSGKKSLLDALYEEGVIPTYSFPKNVVSTYISDVSGKVKYQVERGLDVAIGEYAPGRAIVVDKTTYQIGGLYYPGGERSERTAASPAKAFIQDASYRKSIRTCSQCGWFGLEEDNPDTCPFCGNKALTNMLPMLRPWGFAPRNATSIETAQLNEEYSATQQPLYSTLPDADDVTAVNGCANIRMAVRPNQRIIMLNNGVSGKGFTICCDCGAAMPGDDPAVLKDVLRPYRSKFIKTRCKHSDTINVNLGYDFVTDMLVLEFALDRQRIDINPTRNSWLNRAGQSLAEGLRLAACQELDIEFTELVTGFRVRQNRNGDFVDIYLYDSLSSGAGYAVSIESSIRQLLTKTRELLEGCTCDSACHRCLKHYRNQYIHSVLNRKDALDLLNWGETGARVSAVPYEKQQYLLKSLEQILRISGIHIDVNHESVWAEGRYSKKKVVVYPAMWTKPIEENTIFVSDAHLKYAKPYALKTILDSL